MLLQLKFEIILNCNEAAEEISILSLTAILNGELECWIQFWKGTTQATFGLLLFNSFRGKDIYVKVYDVWWILKLRTPSDGNSSPKPGELNRYVIVEFIKCTSFNLLYAL